MKLFLKILLSLFLTGVTLLPCPSLAETPVTLRYAGRLDPELMAKYAAQTGVRFEAVEVSDLMDEIATALTTHNDTIDLFIFKAQDGLYSVKRHGYYVPLEGDATLSKKLNDLYPAFQNLLTYDGHLVGWIMEAWPQFFQVGYETPLTDNGLTLPKTFGELLDCCQLLIEADALENGRISLFASMPYTAEDMLGLYMQQYIMANTLLGKVPDFTDAGFLVMAERIRSEVPKETTATGEYSYVFCEDASYEGLPFVSDMTTMPTVLEGQTAIETYATVATINPYAKNSDAAIDFLSFCATNVGVDSYKYDASLTEPVPNDFGMELLMDCDAQMAALEQLGELTMEQQDELEVLRYTRDQLEESCWSISEEAIAAYREVAKNLCVAEASPITYDDALHTCASRFVNGALDAGAFGRACQEHIAIICGEQGISME